ncbi:hypothetical protein [Amycolatopsis saalfeldensis]|uniref:Uncharacterized protein n=1 Tax=Amycolatopsis saalfeldensis TaxID=394193 RepID=A0A1H8REC5_9PSEU|nr:hypothetical protein [Amycolatopsis saalfeldensis]SEO64702.1 hypothetical protein SAMN04489732_101755 [Amycolatopsis saalfeldensis]
MKVLIAGASITGPGGVRVTFEQAAARTYDDSLKAVLRARAAGMGWECDRLIAQIDEAPDFYFDSCNQVRLASWSAGNGKAMTPETALGVWFRNNVSRLQRAHSA